MKQAFAFILFAAAGLPAHGGRQIAPSQQSQSAAPSLVYTFGPGNTLISPGGTIIFPPTPAGVTVKLRFNVQNAGSSPTTISIISLAAMVFTLEDVPDLPATLNPGETLSFSIAFAPDTPGDATGGVGVNGVNFALQGLTLVAAVSLTGPGAIVPPAQQENISVRLQTASSVALMGQVVLTFSGSLGDDPAIQFSTGARAAAFSFAPGSTQATFADGTSQIGFQTGTVAGTISLSVPDLRTASGLVVTSGPPAAMLSTAIPAAAPVITSAAAQQDANGFQISVIGFSTTKSVTSAKFLINPTGVGDLVTSTLSADVASAFNTWYQDAASEPFGSMFELTVPFTVSGNFASIGSVDVTLVNEQGSAAPVSVTP